MNTVELFAAREGGYHHYRVPSCVVSPSGVAMVFTEARKNSRGGQQVVHNDYWDIDIQMRRSLDGGATWEDRRLVVDHNFCGDGPISNFVPIADTEANCVHALFCWDYKRVFYVRTDDDGPTWSAPREITDVAASVRDRYAWTAFAVGPGHAICKRRSPHAGRLIVPAWMCASTEGDPHRPSDLTLLYSDDHGETWQVGPTVIRDQQPGADGALVCTPNETTCTELVDGALMFNSRSESETKRRVVTISGDGGETWDTPHFVDALKEPTCHASIMAVPDSDAATGQVLVFTNPDTLDRTMPGLWGKAHDRKNVTAHLSRDAGATWEVLTVIERGPSGYSDLALFPDGDLLCVFECGIIEKMADTRSITMARLRV